MTHGDDRPDPAALPEGFGLRLDRSVRTFRHGTVLVGGHPGRLMALSPEGAEELGRWLEGGPPSPAARRLGRRLVDAGMAHPVAPDATSGRGDVTVVVPVRDRSESLERCLRSLDAGAAVIVVDDGSDDPDAVARACLAYGARLIRRRANGGPGAARNEALPSVQTELVAFVDSDCEVGAGWLDSLTWMFADPGLGAVAPRVRPGSTGSRSGRSVLARYSEARSALDMGDAGSEVGPGRLVSYVPTAALVARAAAVGSGFDDRLRVGEDVDLVWRMLDAGWRVRYEPAVTVFHREPTSWAALLGRRLRYGTSAGPLDRRHPGRLPPLELRPWPTAVAVAVVTGHPAAAVVVLAGSTAALARQLRGRGVPVGRSLAWSAQGAGWTLVGMGHALTTVVGPVVAGALRRRRWVATAGLLMALPPVVDWWRRRPALDPVRWTVASLADDMAYGAGVWLGCLGEGSFGPLVPKLRLGPADGTDRPG
ncbi:MAG TPA: mycofactocin biosynthesis glycosyltransferase MftF [Acidimicrobiales bacterium]